MSLLETLIKSTVSVLGTTHDMLETTTEPYMDTTSMFPVTNVTVDTTTVFPMTNATIITNTTTLSTTHIITNSTTTAHMTTPPTDDTPPGYVGFLTAALAIILYGTNFAPVKKFETGDGMFFQWILCIAIWVTGLIVQLIRHSPEFYPICMLGGLFWETGNICVVPIIKTIGLGLGMCIWGMTNLLSGWATGRFGLFGVDKEHLSSYPLNDVGVILAVCRIDLYWSWVPGLSRKLYWPVRVISWDGLKVKVFCKADNAIAVIFSLVKNNIDGSQDGDIEIVVTEESPLLKDSLSDSESSYSNSMKDTHETIVINDNEKKTNSTVNPEKPSINEVLEEQSFIDKLNPTSKRIVGVSLSVISGFMYGQLFTPAKYLQDHGHSSNGLDYVFSTFCGIILSSTVYFLVYAVIMKNKPKIYPKVIVPGFVSGTMWGVATSSWFVANKVLSNSVAFPIVTTGPGVVASLLGVCVFREITGKKNLLILLLGMTITISGTICSGFSF